MLIRKQVKEGMARWLPVLFAALAVGCGALDPPNFPGPRAETAVYPWADKARGGDSILLNSNYAMGYHFRPQVEGSVTELGGQFFGVKRVRLFDFDSGAILVQTNVGGVGNAFTYRAITPVQVAAGRKYTVAVYLAGSGGSYRRFGASLPLTLGQVDILSSTYAYTGLSPNARPVNSVTSRMYGQADFGFVSGEQLTANP